MKEIKIELNSYDKRVAQLEKLQKDLELLNRN